jgi:hypothetical protein
MSHRFSIDGPRILLGLIFLLGAIDGLAWLLTGNHLIHPVPKPGGIPVAAGPALLAGLLLFAHRDRCATLPR